MDANVCEYVIWKVQEKCYFIFISNLPEEGGENRKGVLENATQINPQRGTGDGNQGLDCSQPCDLVPQPLQEDGEAGGELSLQGVAQVSHHLAHAGDCSLFHLEVSVVFGLI